MALAFLVNASATRLMAVASKFVSGLLTHADLTRLQSAYGVDDGAGLRRALRLQLEAMDLGASITFRKLYELTNGKKLVVCATDLVTCEPRYFGYDTTPDLAVIKALYMSCTLPFVFAPATFRGHLHVDGGLSDNLPAAVWAGEDERALSVDVHRRTEERVDGLAQYAAALIRCVGATTTTTADVHLAPDSSSQHSISLDTSPAYVWNLHAGGYRSALKLFRPDTATLVGTVALTTLLTLNRQGGTTVLANSANASEDLDPE